VSGNVFPASLWPWPAPTGAIPLDASGRLLPNLIAPLEIFGRFGSETGEVGFLKCSRAGKAESGAGILPASEREAGRLPERAATMCIL
jgi:hypothetical protein